jgi:hypothetical protein
MDKKNCPICEHELLYGRVAIRKGIAAKLRWPWPSDRLFFKYEGSDGGTETVIREGASYQGYMCSGCNAVVVTRKKWGTS